MRLLMHFPLGVRVDGSKLPTEYLSAGVARNRLDEVHADEMLVRGEPLGDKIHECVGRGWVFEVRYHGGFRGLSTSGMRYPVHSAIDDTRE